MLEISILSIIIIVISLGASFMGLKASERLGSSNLQLLTAIASGLLLGSAILVVLPEGFHMVAGGGHDDPFAYSPLILGLTILGGFIFMLILEGLGLGHAIHEEHHDHALGHGHGHIHHPKQGLVVTLGLSVHAIGDGLAIGAAAASGETTVSVLVAFGVLVHRVPAALSLGIFSSHESNSKKSLLTGFLIFALASPIAAVVSYLILDGVKESIIGLVMLFSAGTFIYVTTVDTLPAIHNPETGPRSARNVIVSAAIFSAFLLILQSADVLEHSHGHSDGTHIVHEDHDDHDDHDDE